MSALKGNLPESSGSAGGGEEVWGCGSRLNGRKKGKTVEKTEMQESGCAGKTRTQKSEEMPPRRVRHGCVGHLCVFPCRMCTMETGPSKPFMLTPASCTSHSIAMMKATSFLAAEPQMRFSLFL